MYKIKNRRKNNNYYVVPFWKSYLFYILLFILLTSIFFIYWSLQMRFNNPEKEIANNQLNYLKISKTAQLLFYSGDIYYKKANKESWVKLDSSIDLKEGDSVKSADNAWAYIEFDNGSFCRLDANSEIKLEKIQENEIIINNLYGQSFHYANKNKNAFLYKVKVNDFAFTALTEMFNIFNNPQTIILEIFNNNIELSKNNSHEIIAGPALLTINLSTGEIENAKLESNPQDLYNYEWLEWNQQQNKLQHKKEIPLDFIENYPESVELKAKVDENKNVLLTWKFNDDYQEALPYGAYILMGEEENPEYPKNQYLYIPSKDKEGKTILEAKWPNLSSGVYHFRLGVFDGVNSIVKYSNDVKIDLDNNDTAKINLSYKINDDNSVSFNWTAENVESEDSWLLLISENDSPLYPNNTYKQLDINENSYTWTNLSSNKTYEFRLCEYIKEKDECRSYSNVVNVTLNSNTENSNDESTNNEGMNTIYNLNIQASLTDDKDIFIKWDTLDPDKKYLLSISRAFAESKNILINPSDQSYLFKDALEDKTYFITLCELDENQQCVRRSNEMKISVN